MKLLNSCAMKIIMLIETCNRKISERTKYNLITLISAVQVLCSLLLPVVVKDSFSVVVIIGILSFLLYTALLFSSKKFIQCKLNKFYFGFLIIIGVSFITNGVFFGVIGYLVIGLIFMCLLPIFYKTLATRRDILKIISAFCKGITLTFLIFFIMSLFFGPPFDMNQYSSFLSNPNTFSAFMAVVVGASLFLLNVNYKHNTRNVIFFVVIICIATSLCFYSNSRTNMLCIISQISVYVVKYVVEAIRERKIFEVCGQIISCIFLLIVAFALNFFLFTTIHTYIQDFIFQYEDNEVEQYDSDISIFDTVGIATDRFNKGLNGEGNDAFTSGRIGIWKDYIKEISFVGHAKESRDIINGDRVYHDTNAHNAYLQVAYSAGIIAGLSLIAIMIIMGIKLLKTAVLFLINKESILNSKVMFMASTYLCFFVSAITSGGYMIFTYFPATLFWFSGFILMANNVEERKK